MENFYVFLMHREKNHGNYRSQITGVVTADEELEYQIDEMGLFLEAYQFIVNYCFGRKYGNADVLSRAGQT